MKEQDINSLPMPEIGDYSIFENQADVAENVKQSAEDIGANTGDIENIKKGKPTERFVAKSNCRWCNGVGTISFAPSPQKEEKGKKKRNRGKNFKSNSKRKGYTRNTSKPEGAKNIQWRTENMIKALCKCVRVHLE